LPSWSRNYPDLWNRNVHYRVRISPSIKAIPSQINLVHTPTPHFLKISFNIILQYPH